MKFVRISHSYEVFKCVLWPMFKSIASAGEVDAKPKNLQTWSNEDTLASLTMTDIMAFSCSSA